MGKLSKKLVSIITAIVVSSSLVFTSVGSTIASAATVVSDENETQQELSSNDYGLADNCQDGAILHAWCWSFNTIKENMKEIAESGYTSVQTSPAQECLQGLKGNNPSLDNKNTPDGKENWYYHYQPTSFTLGNYQLGTADEFEAMCKEAKKYGLKVIVDVVANHISDTTSKCDQELVNNCHNQGKIMPNEWNNRVRVTQGDLIGMPDLNSESAIIQKKVLDYMKECVNRGADGFRFDAAKSIALPVDSNNSQFWPTIINGIKAVKPDTYIYGETLQDNGKYKAVLFSEYSKYMSVTASQYGWWLRATVGYEKYEDENGNVGQTTAHGKASLSREGRKWILESMDCVADGESKVSADKLVGWVESHDTYANAGASRDLTKNQIKLAWSILGSREGIAPLFFNRPVSYPNFKIGAKGSNDFKDADIVAINKFHNAMVGKRESVTNPTGEVMMIQRGNKGEDAGVVLVNVGSTASISVQTTLKDGTYENKSSDGGTFKVSNGVLTGEVKGSGTAILYNGGTIVTDPQVTISQEGGNYTDTLSLTLGYKNATSATYSIDNASSKTYSNGTTIKIGADKNVGDKTTIKLTAIDDNGKEATKTYTFTKIKKVVYSADAYIKLPSGWSAPNIYVYDESGTPVKEVAKWPGVAMTKISDDLYGYKLPDGWTSAQVIFNSGSNQYPGAREPGLVLKAGQPMIYENGEWKEYNGGALQLGEISADKVSPQPKGSTIKLTAKASGGDGSYSYIFMSEGPDGENIIGESTDGSIAWSPSSVGTYTITATVTDGSGDKQSKTLRYVIEKPDERYPVIDKISGSKSGSSITYTVNASGGENVGTGLLFYKFYILDSNGNKSIGQNYSRSNTFTTTANRILVEVQNSLNDTVSKEYKYSEIIDGPSITSFNTNLASPQILGNSIKLTANAKGTGTIKYKFTAEKNGEETVIRGYSTSNTATWTPDEIGTYTLHVYVKDDTGKESEDSVRYIIKNDNKELVINDFYTNLASPQNINTPIKLTTEATGTGDVTYKFTAVKNGVTSVIKNYSTSNTATWTPTEEGTYTIRWYAKDSTGTEIFESEEYVIKKPIVITKLEMKNYSTSVDSPQKVGNSIKLNANAVGEGTVQYRFVAYSGEYSEVINDYSTSSSVTWTPKKAGTYNIYFVAKDSTGKTVQKVIYNYVVNPVQVPLNMTSYSLDKQSPQKVGTSLKLSATAIGQGTVQYRFVAYSGTYSEVIKDFSTSSSVTWTPKKAGTYNIYYVAKDSTGKTVQKVINNYVVKDNLSITSFNTNVDSPQKVGSNITLKVQVNGATEGTECKFVAKKGTEITVIKDYDAKNAAVWTPTKEGSYELYVYVRDANGNSVAKMMSYIVINSLNINKFIAEKLSPQQVGTSINLSGTATGEGTIKYRFVAYSGEYSEVIKDFSTSSSVTWIPKKAGTYNIYFVAKDSTGKTVQKVINNYVVKSAQASLSMTSYSVDKQSPQNVGTSLKLSAAATGEGAVQYRFVAYSGEYSEVIKDFSTSSSVTWTPKKAGTYNIYFVAKDSTGKTVQKVINNYVVKTAQASLSMTSYKIDKQSPQNVGTLLKLSATATGQGTLQYRFVAYSGEYSEVIKDFSTSSSVTWTPKKAGTYNVYFVAKDSTGKTVQKFISNYVVK